MQSFFTGLISTASSSSYVLGGCKRTRTTDATVQTGLSVSWQTRTITSICLEGGSTVDLGIEYSYAQGGSEMVSASSFGVQGNFYRTSRSERWNAAGIADWSAAGATAQWNATYGTTDMTQTLTVDQTGVAQVTVMNEQADGSASQDVKKVQAVPLWAGYNYYRTPADMNLGDGHPLWSTTGTDTQGRTVSETARYGDGGTTIQTIGTTYSAGGGSTRSYINQNGDTVTLSYQSDGVTSGGQTTTTSTDAQGITTTTVTDATTGNLISETRQGVTTNYATTTNADGSTTQTVTQTAGGEAPRTQSVTVADAQGRTLSVTDANGSITQYDYSNHGRTVTQTLPSGGTRVTTNYLDGQLNSITGTAVTPEYHHYTVNDGSVAPYEAGSITETVYYITDNSSCWSKTTTNFLGQTLLREVPSPSGSGTSATTYTYNGLGQLVKTSSPGMADLITAYDEWGNVSQQGCESSESCSWDQVECV